LKPEIHPNDKHKFLFLISQGTYCSSIAKDNWSRLYGDVIGVYYKQRLTHNSHGLEKIGNFLTLKQVVHIVTIVLRGV
jgi:hypothetical protein